ncbi:T9SS type A sorting domain-containing protein [Chryseolinea sp. H1M3-3]|uniref:T9SS type A sorting domain-containing protein n=1 Tax=Chryseolinea sp. H1M3-3 TaxID=3034144 RepID=UPI0023EB7BC2|nr:T9SS type A sorting domain-containing protein [Chryseolinea sp. H1M3-3]
MKRYNTILIGLLCLLFATDALATKRKKKSSPSCSNESYSSEIVKQTPVSETCVEYEIKVSYDGARTYGLSHYSIAIPCGEIKNATNSENWKMVFGKDRTTGVYGLKVDDISGFNPGESFTIKFTWCSSGTCTKELGIVAAKFGQCVDIDTLQQEQPEPPQNCSALLATIQKKNLTCPTGNDGEMQVIIQEGQEPYTYSWSNGSMAATAQNLTAGNYAVTIKDAKGNTLTLTDQITSPAPILISESIINPSCSGVGNGMIDLNVSGGTGSYSFAWSNGASLQNLTSLVSGLYTVTVTDSLGCSVQKTFMLTNSSLLTLGSSLRHASCSKTDGAIDITPFGGVAPYTYLWSTGATTEDLQNAGAGTYTVKATDALGCSVERSYTLRVNNSMSVTFIVTPTSCLGDNSGAIDLSVSGGTAPYTIQWQDGPTSEDRSGLVAGNYKVTVTDAGGCSVQQTISVFKKPLQVSSIVNQPTCSGDLGTITVTPTDGVAPYTYTWSNGDTDNTISGLVNGIYSVTVTDASGCTRTLFFAILTPTPIEVTSAVNNSQCGQEGSYAIDLTVMGGKFPYTYNWSTGATTQDVTGLNTGTYSVDIKDGSGCVVTKQFVVEPASVSWSCLITPITTPVVCKSAGNVLSTGVVGASAFEWTVASTDGSWAITSGSGDSTAVFTAGNAGSTATFTLTITKNGCTQTCSYTVSGGCIVRDNTGGGDPSSSEPCVVTQPPPVDPLPEEPQEEPEHSCKPKIHVYPNPFKDKVKFEYKASANDKVRLEIYDARGKRIAVVYEGHVSAGKTYSFDWSAIGCGKDKFYYYRLTTSKSVDHGKLVRK